MCRQEKQFCALEGRLDGRVAVVTGASSGLGLQTTAELARRGATVIMACRDMERARSAKQRILTYYGEGLTTVYTHNVVNSYAQQYLAPVMPNQLIPRLIDLASFKSVLAFANWVKKSELAVNYLINNAGIMATPYALTQDGLEMQMGVNYVGHFLLTQLLLPSMRKAERPVRIINISSIRHYRGYIPMPDLSLHYREYNRWRAYDNSKLANVIHAKELSVRLKNEGIVAVSVHPGIVETNIIHGFPAKCFRLFSKLIARSAWEGVQTTLFVVLAPEVVPGAFYADCRPVRMNPLAEDRQYTAAVWRISRRVVAPAFLHRLHTESRDDDRLHHQDTIDTQQQSLSE